MKSRMLHTCLLSTCLLMIVISSCRKHEQDIETGLFRPMFIANQIVVNGNVIHYLWYGIKEATSYTFELSSDSFQTAPLRSIELTDTKIKVEGLDYERTYQARVKANTADSTVSSGWAMAPEQVLGKRVLALVLKPVDRMEISDTTARVRWNKNYTVDSLSLQPLTGDPGALSQSIKMSSTDVSNGYYDFKNLSSNTVYEITIYNSIYQSAVDRPYNSIMVQTSGAPAGAVKVGIHDNLIQMLIDAEEDPGNPGGRTYYLPSGGVYYFAEFESGAADFDSPTKGRGITFSKPFNLIGSSSGVRPKIYITSDWKPEGTFSGGIHFEGIDFEGLLTVGTSGYKPYLLNLQKSTTIPEVSLVNCRFSNLVRAIISCNQDDEEPATVQRIFIDNCIFTSEAVDGYGILHGNKHANNFLKDVTIQNSTFANMPKGKGLVANVNKITTNVKIRISNCSFYNSQAAKESFLDLGMANANITIENCLFASPFESSMVKIGSGAINATFNYATRDFAVGSNSIDPTILPDATASDLMVKPDNNDLTIKLMDSPVYLRLIGDPRWIK